MERFRRAICHNSIALYKDIKLAILRPICYIANTAVANEA